MPIQIKNKQGKFYYVHGRGKFLYCSKDKRGALDELPEGYEVKFTKAGLPFVKRK